VLAKFNNQHIVSPTLSKHCLGTIVTSNASKLFDGVACSEAVARIIEHNSVTTLGEQLHVFSNKSFTLLFALAESHISIHTWPERLTVQLDVFLCNYINDNSEKCENIYNEIVSYFDAVENDSMYIERL
jgi:S-adenosylmethionine decarboxylase